LNQGKVTVIGIGLIGGSLALCIKERTEYTVCGCDVSERSLELARASGVIDEGTTDLAEAVKDADYLFLAVPVGLISRLMAQLREMPLKPGCIISDVGSTKGEIVRHGRELSRVGVTFIGGHPMAGSHRSGVEAADPLLFENAYYILTPTPETSLVDMQRLSRLLQVATRAQLVIMDPDHHDRVVGAISHLPHVIAAGLVNQVGRYNEENEWFHRLAAGGFRDLTRIAASHPVMWRDILMSNRHTVLSLMDDWLEEMQRFRRAIEADDEQEVEALFDRAKRLREQLPDRKKGILLRPYECYVNVPDRPGMIGEVATLLGKNGINLSNIGVMENREEEVGVLRLSFRTEEDLTQAVAVLKQANYTVIE
jgi:prephenate dehydrogenase